MEWLFIVLLLLGVPLWLVIWLIVRAVRAGNRIEELSRRIGQLELEVFQLKQRREAAPSAQPETPTTAAESVSLFTPPSEQPETVVPPPPLVETIEETVAPVSAEPSAVAKPPPIPAFATTADAL
ncbi:MAG TPA: hypothetical protein PKA41_16990, partial [Verrucomicrobiota bacterium]|nr:hypothetical protein [Verrucomicrobiota bacterium]